MRIFHYAAPRLEAEVVATLRQKYVRFRGYRFDQYRMRVIAYDTRIGPSVHLLGGQTVVQGPSFMREEEFQGWSGSSGINGSPGFKVDPETAKRKKAEYDEMMRFRALVEKAIR